MATEKDGTEKPDEKPEEKKTPAKSEVDEKTYKNFASMMNRFLSEKEEADKDKPHRTPASKPDETPSVLQRLFGG
jgi:hypothetical protein